MNPDLFKQCSACFAMWMNRGDFLADPAISLVGYQVHFEELTTGLFLFNHLTPRCNTTLAVPASEFLDLYQGETFADRMTGTKDCPGYCLYTHQLKACPVHCECAYVREILQIVRNWKKRAA